MDEIGDYSKYRWFLTSGKKLVIGGKSAVQNEQLVKSILKAEKKYIIMHTHEPGSPFSIILAPVKQIKPKELKEAAIFTASFSRAWRKGLKEVKIDIFTTNDLYKKKGMKAGTFAVLGEIKTKRVELELVLTKQKDKLRAVPKSAANKILAHLKPGKKSKEKIAEELAKKLKTTKQEVLQALPPGGFK